MMLIKLINQLLNDEDGISESAYCALIDYLTCEKPTDTERSILQSLSKQIKTANGRYYLSQDLNIGETIDE